MEFQLCEMDISGDKLYTTVSRVNNTLLCIQILWRE